MLCPRIEPTRVGGAGGLPLLFDDVVVTGVCLRGGAGGFPLLFDDVILTGVCLVGGGGRFPFHTDNGVLLIGGGGGFPFGSDTVLGGGAGGLFADVPFVSRFAPSGAWSSIELARF